MYNNQIKTTIKTIKTKSLQHNNIISGVASIKVGSVSIPTVYDNCYTANPSWCTVVPENIVECISK